MSGYKENFIVRSKFKKEGEKGTDEGNETKVTYRVFLVNANDSSQKVNLHSEIDLGLSIGDELEIKAVNRQAKLE